MTEEQQENATLPSWILNEILDYLSRQPYVEVAHLIAAVHEHVEVDSG